MARWSSQRLSQNIFQNRISLYEIIFICKQLNTCRPACKELTQMRTSNHYNSKDNSASRSRKASPHHGNIQKEEKTKCLQHNRSNILIIKLVRKQGTNSTCNEIFNAKCWSNIFSLPGRTAKTELLGVLALSYQTSHLNLTLACQDNFTMPVLDIRPLSAQAVTQTPLNATGCQGAPDGKHSTENVVVKLMDSVYLKCL